MHERWIRLVSLAGFVAAALAGSAALAGNGGYFTTYNSEVESGEVELMLMNDFTRPSRFHRNDGIGNYFSHMLELEYGVTNQLATALMIE